MNRHYPSNRDPLKRTAFVALPIGAVRPLGWLRDQLTIQADGLTGHLDEFWPSLANSAWKGDAAGEAWERGPYFLDGAVPLAYILDDARLKAKVRPYIEWTLASGRPDGWFGPAENRDRWPLAVAMKVLTQYYEATGDERVITILKNYFAYLRDNPPDWPDKDWRGVRAMDNAVSGFWLYNRTGDAGILRATESIYRNSFDWGTYFLDFPYTAGYFARFPYRDEWKKSFRAHHPTHVVNIAMGIKYPAVWYQQFGEDRLKKAAYQALANLDTHHGQVGGRFGGDEHLAGRCPTQGSELCSIVEYMFSLEKTIEALGDVIFADRLELLAYNGNPGTCTPDYWAHQYDQQANQVLVSIARRQWSTNGDTSNVYGLEPNFGCCTANMHQGWPKFVAHLWMATHDQGLAAVAFGPCQVKAKVADGAEVTVTEETDYPFDGTIRFVLETAGPVRFPLHVRIPAWADGARLTAGGVDVPTTAGRFAVVDRQWKAGDTAVLTLPMKLRTETRYNNAVSILRGPLYFALKIGERFEKLDKIKLNDRFVDLAAMKADPQLHKMAELFEKTPLGDYAIHPTTPWNYGLIVDRAHPEKSITVETRKPGRVPFEQAAAAVTLKVKGRAIPEWTLRDNSAGETPISPVVCAEPTVDLELIPYGNTRLRITEFPVIAE